MSQNPSLGTLNTRPMDDSSPSHMAIIGDLTSFQMDKCYLSDLGTFQGSVSGGVVSPKFGSSQIYSGESFGILGELSMIRNASQKVQMDVSEKRVAPNK